MILLPSCILFAPPYSSICAALYPYFCKTLLSLLILGLWDYAKYATVTKADPCFKPPSICYFFGSGNSCSQICLLACWTDLFSYPIISRFSALGPWPLSWCGCFFWPACSIPYDGWYVRSHGLWGVCENDGWALD